MPVIRTRRQYTPTPVIEFDPSLPGYKGRRVVQFTRIDTRSETRQGTSASAAGSSRTVIKHPLESAPLSS
jgi:hypothetical protein